jgi:hypothetical protein
MRTCLAARAVRARLLHPSSTPPFYSQLPPHLRAQVSAFSIHASTPAGLLVRGLQQPVCRRGERGGGSKGEHAYDGKTDAWKLLVPAAGLGCMMMANQGDATEARCDGEEMSTAQMSTEQLKIASMSANKASGNQSPFMAKIEAYGTMAVPYINMAVDAIEVVAPVAVRGWQIVRSVYNALPITIIEALGGLAMCFFGGMYPLTIAAVQTFQVSGGDVALKCLEDIWEELVAVYEANQADNHRDDDGDGIFDVEQVDNKELLSRKMALVFKVAFCIT